MESTTYSKSLQTLRLQDLHTAHWSPGLHAVASVPAKTAHKPPIKISTLIAGFIVTHMAKEAKRRASPATIPQSTAQGQRMCKHVVPAVSVNLGGTNEQVFAFQFDETRADFLCNHTTLEEPIRKARRIRIWCFIRWVVWRRHKLAVGGKCPPLGSRLNGTGLIRI